jgi:hypothetical protein
MIALISFVTLVALLWGRQEAAEIIAWAISKIHR